MELQAEKSIDSRTTSLIYCGDVCNSSKNFSQTAWQTYALFNQVVAGGDMPAIKCVVFK
jgi:hypothetical protein